MSPTCPVEGTRASDHPSVVLGDSGPDEAGEVGELAVGGDAASVWARMTRRECASTELSGHVNRRNGSSALGWRHIKQKKGHRAQPEAAELTLELVPRPPRPRKQG